MKLAELSHRASVGYMSLANAESRNECISFEAAVRLARVLPDTEPDDLLLPQPSTPAEDAEEESIKAEGEPIEDAA